MEHAGGKCLLNSTNYEDGEPRFLKVLEFAKQYGAGMVIGLIDEVGMARTAEDKIRIARRAYQDSVKFGINAHDIFFDPLALPISTGIEEDRANASETIKAIKQIKEEMPDANIILGVSNISFGLNPAARVVLNSIFLHECVEAGMNSAIVNASKILPLNRFNEHEIDVALDLIYDRRKFDGDIVTYDPLGEFTTMFEGKTTKSMKKDISSLPIEERLKEHIIEGEKIGLEDNLKLALEKYPALEIINTILLGGMKVVGDLFGSGQMQLPFVLQSAEAMKAAVKFLEPFMDKVEGESNKGVMVLATVKGDVHDIGKNLVDIILTNNGYKVVNLGIKQHVDAIFDSAVEHNADAIGMSGLLVKSTLVMRDNLEIMNERGLKTPVVLGGAALNRKYVDNDLVPLFEGRLFYARDAFDGLNAMDLLTTKGHEENTEEAESKNEIGEAAKRQVRTICGERDAFKRRNRNNNRRRRPRWRRCKTRQTSRQSFRQTNRRHDAHDKIKHPTRRKNPDRAVLRFKGRRDQRFDQSFRISSTKPRFSKVNGNINKAENRRKNIKKFSKKPSIRNSPRSKRRRSAKNCSKQNWFTAISRVSRKATI